MSQQPPPQGSPNLQQFLTRGRSLSSQVSVWAIVQEIRTRPQLRRDVVLLFTPRGPALQTSAKGSGPFKLFILRISLGLPQGPAKGCGNWVIVYLTYQTLLEGFLALAVC